MNDQVWIFASPSQLNAAYRLPSGVFSKLDAAEAWISENRLTGVLVAYPVDRACIDWALENSNDDDKKKLKAKMNDASFIAEFSSDLQQHYFYDHGQRSR